MKLSISRDFANWSISVPKKRTCIRLRRPVNFYSSESLRALTSIGFTRSSLVQAFGSVKHTASVGFIHAETIDIFVYYWANGDTLCFPVNPKGEVYIGGSEAFWWSIFPFLHPTDNSAFFCNLPKISLPNTDRTFLLLGAQAHFGHFVGDRLLPVMDIVSSCDSSHPNLPPAYILGPSFPFENISLLRKVWPKSPPFSFALLPGTSAIYNLADVLVPSFEFLPELPLLRSGTPELSKSLYQFRKVAFLGSSLKSRLDNYSELLAALREADYFIVEEPEVLDLDYKSTLLANADTALFGTGSVAWNVIHCSQSTRVILLFPAELLSCVEPKSTCMLHQFYLPMLSRRTQIIELATLSTNPVNAVRSIHHISKRELGGIC
mgnify:CR=1 FL=1